MDIEELRTFVEVADAGGVSTAARRLGVAKSLVSRHLARLEVELGVQLPRGAALTEAGATFRTMRPKPAPRSTQPEKCSHPRAATFGPTHLAPVLADMARRHPQLHIHTVYSDRFIDLVAEGFDCAVRVGYLQASNLIARHVGPIYGIMYARRA